MAYAAQDATKNGQITAPKCSDAEPFGIVDITLRVMVPHAEREAYYPNRSLNS
jgi:hypothetical protein